MKKHLIILSILWGFLQVNAQTDSVKISSSSTTDSLVVITDSASSADDTPLLPDHYLFTQRLMWGEKGLMRNFNVFKLSPESRDLEMEIRSKMVTIHQLTGYAALASMLATGLVGWKLYDGNQGLKGTHEALAATTNALYYTTAALAFFAPPPMRGDSKGISGVKVHRVLSIVHLSSMITTQVLSGMIERRPELKPYHRAAAITAFGSLLAASIVVKF